MSNHADLTDETLAKWRSVVESKFPIPFHADHVRSLLDLIEQLKAANVRAADTIDALTAKVEWWEGEAAAEANCGAEWMSERDAACARVADLEAALHKVASESDQFGTWPHYGLHTIARAALEADQ